jgi:hypothetical protein
MYQDAFYLSIPNLDLPHTLVNVLQKKVARMFCFWMWQEADLGTLSHIKEIF